ncbi:MAG TPA: radical SAM protein [Sandaracinaceae bacterium LLY-WYZ-13_1]|nr:radical SAM protein [Sandaracinaceae bacterium LLY-WYZ-13_1]
MGRVLVVHPPCTVARDWIDYPYLADLGAVQLAAAVRERFGPGAATLVDAFALESSTLHWRRDGRGHLGASVDELLSRVEDAGPWDGARDAVVVAVTPFHRPPHRDDVLAAVLRGLRAITDDAPQVLADAYQSGQHYVETDALLEAYPEADAWVKYEAERTVPALLGRWRDGERPTGVHRGERPEDLDALPLPAWDLVDLPARDRFCARVIQRSGRPAWQFPIDGRTLPVITSRGCPFRCAHCSSNPDVPIGAPKTQRRCSTAYLERLFEALVSTHGATRLTILDELVNVRRRHFDAVLDRVERHDVAVEVPNGFRADYLSREHLARLRGRITTVSVSAESGSQRVLDEVVGKQLDLREIERVAREAAEVGVPLLVHWMVGLPGETAPEINETLERALDLYDRFGAEPAVQYATPLPGTRLAQGRSLPVVDDWGPCFQTRPTQPGAAVDAETLARFRWTFERRLEASRGPEKLIMNVTYTCNNRCTFCAVGTRTQVDGHPTRQREYLDAYRARGVTMVDFDGGEPTLNPELVPLIRHARHIGYERVNVTTNGRRCAYDDYARALVTSGLTTLLFSVHGPDKRSHAQQVGVAEAFDQTLEGIRRCVAHRPSGVELGMNVTITKGNHTLLEPLAQLAWDEGLPWLNLQFLTPFGRATKWVAPDTERAAELAMGLIDRWKDRMKIQVINLPFCFMPGYEDHLAGDLNKLARHMVFVNNETVNLADYLAERRVRKPVCEGCPHRCFCGGFYDLEDAPEPPWLIAPEDLLRPVRPA